MDIVDDELSVEDLDNFEKKITELDQTIAALEVLGGKCGCTVGNGGTTE